MSPIDVEARDDVAVARPRGDVDAANARQVRDALAVLVEEGYDSVVLDLTDTQYLDSAGIDMLLRLGERLRERRAVLALVIPEDAPLRRLAEIVGLDRAVAVYDTVEGALGARSA